MNKMRLLLTLITMLALAYAVLEIKSFLSVNFIENETPVKKKLNSFLNGEVPVKRPIKQQTNGLDRSGRLQTPPE
jgi:hypothetical protein